MSPSWPLRPDQNKLMTKNTSVAASAKINTYQFSSPMLTFKGEERAQVNVNIANYKERHDSRVSF